MKTFRRGSSDPFTLLCEPLNCTRRDEFDELTLLRKGLAKRSRLLSSTEDQVMGDLTLHSPLFYLAHVIDLLLF